MPSFDPDRESYYSHVSEARVIEELGGMPVVLPYVRPELAAEVVDLCDGVLLAGGNDFDPGLYGGTRHPAMSTVTPERDAFELALIPVLLARDIPTLGICRGMQILNVALGGTIHDHTLDAVPDAKDHRDGSPVEKISHAVRIPSGTRLADAVRASTIRVNSLHHQAVRDLGDGLVVSAVSSDGLIEAFESRDHRFVLGVQWHPERIWEIEPGSKRVLEALLQASEQFAAGMWRGGPASR